MESCSFFIFILLFISMIAHSRSIQLFIEPNAKIITKYEGDAINLTCFIENDKNKTQDALLASLDIINTPSHTLNWILPSNGQERVRIMEERRRVTIYIENLTESDHGNYTCSLFTENGTLVKRLSIYLSVLARGRFSSCTPKSFSCDKTVCIPDRYECDGIPDCPNGLDEIQSHCGPDPCFGKLPCEGGRCLSPQECCREPGKSPPNCTIHSSIRCCRQLIHPALLDQDLYFLASRPNVGKEVIYYHTAISLIIAGFMLLLVLVTIAVVMSIRYRFCRLLSPTQSNWHRSSPWSVCNPQQLMGPPQQHPTDQYLLQSSNCPLDHTEYIRRIPGLRSDLFSPSVLRGQSLEDSTIVLIPLTRSRIDCGPPPSYQQVIGAPPPPYSSDAESQIPGFESSLLSTVSTSNLFSNNNNNGDINGNMTSRTPVAHNRNLTDVRPTSIATNSSSFIPSVSRIPTQPVLSTSENNLSGYGFLHRK